MKRVLLLFLICAASLHAQCGPSTPAFTVSGRTWTATTAGKSDVSAAIAAEQAVAQDGDVISIPAGSCAWSGGVLSLTFTKSVTLQGAGAISSTAGGASITGTDVTALTNHNTGNQSIMAIATTAGKSFRFTGIAALEDASSTTAFNGIISFSGQTSSLRIDHSHFLVFVNGSKGLGINGGLTGVADHIYINTTQTVSNNFTAYNGGYWKGDSGGYGNNGWADADNFGTAQFFYVEDSQINGGYVGDCSVAGRYVIRHSTVNTSAGMEQHGTHDQYRGCRASEAYQNTFTNSTTVSGGAVHNNSGPTLIWGNTVTGYNNVIDVSMSYRRDGVPYGTVPAPPNGFGMCGTGATGGPSVWDQNSNASTGYACIDQPGRGAGDLLTNYNTSFADVLNSTTGTRTWPHQALSPVYVWNNSLGTGGNAVVGNHGSGVLADNQDFYQQYDPLGEPGSNCTTSPCHITVGVNQTNRDPVNGTDTCTAGLGGNTPGVGWWNSNNSKLWVCNPTNTWAVYYTPYTYPHPLISPAMAIIPTSQNFGTINVGSSSSAVTFTVLNNSINTAGNVTPSISGGNAGDFIIVNSGTGSCSIAGVSLAVGASCTFTITFSPSAPGARSTNLNVTYTGADGLSPLVAGLSGTGGGSSGISLNPSSIAFPNTAIGFSATPVAVTLQNTGAVALSISSISIVGVGFSQTNNCPGSVAPSATCQIVITFLPTNFITFNATLTVVSSAPSSPSTVPLSGLGISVAPTNGVILGM